MRLDSAQASALQGVRKGEQRIDRSAHTIANTSLGDGQGQRDGTQALVDLKVASLDVQASVKVLKTVDDTLGTLLDTKA